MEPCKSLIFAHLVNCTSRNINIVLCKYSISYYRAMYCIQNCILLIYLFLSLWCGAQKQNTVPVGEVKKVHLGLWLVPSVGCKALDKCNAHSSPPSQKAQRTPLFIISWPLCTRWETPPKKDPPSQKKKETNCTCPGQKASLWGTEYKKAKCVVASCSFT